jgi:hypothetical protein
MLTDDDRRYLHDALEHAHGPRAASLLMSLLPPTGWADLATRQDLEALRVELRGEMAQLRGEVRGEIAGMLPKLLAANIASMIGVAGLVLGAVAIAA